VICIYYLVFDELLLLCVYGEEVVGAGKVVFEVWLGGDFLLEIFGVFGVVLIEWLLFGFEFGVFYLWVVDVDALLVAVRVGMKLWCDVGFVGCIGVCLEIFDCLYVCVFELVNVV